ncbi:MAG TPA: hypothetical protein VD886_17155, partial [Herpetosiphonaceae bacterium]|nr:hypothetical protein [Herpetosiphonaceae bacterium]
MKQSIDQPSASYSVPSLRKTRPALWSVLWRWTALTSLGLVISSFVIAIIIGLLFGIEAEINDGFFITSMAAMAALPAGLCQWIFLHRRAKVSVWW